MRVCKFGGTSVGSAERMRQVAEIIQENETAIVVLSAMAGTTNTLINIVQLIKENKTGAAGLLINQLKLKYLNESNQLFSDFGKSHLLDDHIDGFFKHILEISERNYKLDLEKEVLAQGELITTHVFSAYLNCLGLAAENISALKFMRTDINNEPDHYYINERLAEMIHEHPKTRFYITQGYICKNVEGKIDNLGRGGSDYSATIIAAAINADLVQIWTDIDGMHNNDPRYVNSTQSIEKLSYTEAEELAYFGAKILHPTCISPARVKNVPILIKNTLNPKLTGTLITNEHKDVGIKAVAAKDGIIAIKIKSGRMMMAYGFLRKVFEIFEAYKTPIDMVTTSEVTVSMTIDNDLYLNEIVKKLEQLGEVTVSRNQSIVCIVGNFHDESRGLIGQVGMALADIPIRMLSFGSNNSNITLLVNTDQKAEALNYLSESLFKTPVYV